MQVIEFRNRRDVEGWLRGRPRADAVMLAARAALRVLPALAAGVEPWARSKGLHRDYTAVIVLPVLRAMATPWVDVQYSTQGIAAAARAAALALAADARAVADARAAYAATAAANAASAAIRAAAVRGTAARATSAAARAVSADASAEAYAAVATDAEALDAGITAIVLADRPLWPTGVPEWAATGWERLKADLLARNEGWEVWTDWYEARRDGRRSRRSIEIVRVTLDESLWKAGPKTVNAEIRRLIDEDLEKAKPPEERNKPPPDGTERLVQRPSSHRFDWRADRLEATPVTERPFDPVLAEVIAEGLREKAADVLAALTGNHADDVVSRDVQRALDLLNAPVDGIAEGVLLMRANTIAAHARAYADAGSDRERSIRAILDDVSTSLGNLVDCYPGVRLINANRLELDVQEADAPAIAAELDAIADLAKASPIVATSVSAALDVGRAETADLEAKIAGPSGAGRAGYIAARAKVVAVRLLDTTNFVSATAQRAGSQVAGLGRDTWTKIRKVMPKAAARGLVDGVEGGLRALTSLPEAGAIALMHHIGVPWEMIALMVPRLQPHARKVKQIEEAVQETQKPDDLDMAREVDADDPPGTPS